MRISIAGTGYVGLVTGVCLAKYGHEVICVEKDAARLALLQNGRSPIFEAGVEELMAECAERLAYTSDHEAAYRAAEVIFVCVGTPERSDGSANLQQVNAAVGQIAESVQRDCVVVIKSTVPIGTNDKLENSIAARVKKGLRIDVASNPEFLAQGTAVKDFLYGPRLVLGVKNRRSADVLKQVFAQFGQEKIVTDRRTAEMIKYASNNFLALKISYINEIANICEMIGADVETVAYGMGLDNRIGSKFLRAGIGYGGSCFPKDTKALHWLARYHDYEIKTVKAAIEVNENQKIRLIKKAKKHYGCLEGLTAAVLGLTFKPGTDDLRDAPSILNIPLLLEEGVKVRAWDPTGQAWFEQAYPGEISCCDTIEQALSGADMCFILTEWSEIKDFDLKKYARYMKKALVLDGRNCYSLSTAKKAGILYDSIGRRTVL